MGMNITAARDILTRRNLVASWPLHSASVRHCTAIQQRLRARHLPGGLRRGKASQGATSATRRETPERHDASKRGSSPSRGLAGGLCPAVSETGAAAGQAPSVMRLPIYLSPSASQYAQATKNRESRGFNPGRCLLVKGQNSPRSRELPDVLDQGCENRADYQFVDLSHRLKGWETHPGRMSLKGAYKNVVGRLHLSPAAEP